MSRVDLLLKLTVDRDRRTNQGEVEQHSVKHAFSVFSENLSKMLLMNLLYAFIFASMPTILQWISAIIPPRYYIQAMRKLMIMGVGIQEVWPEYSNVEE